MARRTKQTVGKLQRERSRIEKRKAKEIRRREAKERKAKEKTGLDTDVITE